MGGGGDEPHTRAVHTKPFISFQFILKTNSCFNKEAEMNKSLSFVNYTLNITVDLNR